MEEAAPDALTRADWQYKSDAAFQCWVASFSRREGKGSAPNSLNMYEAMFGAFRQYLVEREESVLTIGPNEIKDFLNNREGCDRKAPITGSSKIRRTEMVARALQPSTKWRYASLLDKLMDYLVGRGYRQTNPVHMYVRALKVHGAQPAIVFLSEPVEKLLQEYLLHRCDTLAWADRRRRAMLLFMLGTGVNSAQATAACVDDFDVNDRAISFQIYKTTAAEDSRFLQYQVPLSMFCSEQICAWLDERRAYLDSPDCLDHVGSRLAFPRAESGGRLSGVGLYFHVNDCLREIGFDGRDMGPRVLRYTFMRRQLLNGLPDEALMFMCGLKTDKTLRRIERLTFDS
jgi:site-specific recombinase XerD